MRSIFSNLFKNEYLKNISTLAGGVLLSQSITLAFSPILTRIYEPQDFGVIATFIAVVNITTVIATLRYENAIVLPFEEKEAKNLKVFSVLIVAAFSIAIFCISLVSPKFFSNILLPDAYSDWLFWIPVMVILNGFFHTFRNWLVRKKDFGFISKGAVLKSISINVILLGGAFFFSPAAIIFLIANVFSQALETSYLYLKILKNEGRFFKNIDYKSGFKTLNKYKDFPKYSLFADLVNSYTVQNPIILLTFFYGLTPVGLFSVTERVLGVPIKLISSTTLEVYKQRASEEFTKYGSCRSVFLETFRYLILASIIPTIVIAIFSPQLFEFVFGEEWKIAGYFAQALSIKFFFQITVRPLGFTLMISGKQRYYLFWQIALLISTSLGLILGYLQGSVELSILYYSLAYSLMYFIYFLISYKASIK